MTTPRLGDADGSVSGPSTRRFWILAACCTVAFSRAVDPKLWLAGLDTPGMVFGFPGEEFRLLSAILVVVVLAGILLGGLFGDLWGRRRVMLLSLVVSTATGVAAQIVVDTPWLTIVRVLTAATGAMALPLTLAVIRLTFEGRERQVTMFIYTVVCEGALLVALVALVQVIEGDLLASMLPTALSMIGLYLAWRYVPESRASQQLRQHAATSIAWALTFLPLTLAFVSAQLSDRWNNPVTLVAGAIGCLGIVALALAWRGRIRVSATANIRRRRRHLLSVMLLTAAALTLGITGYAVELYRFFSVVKGYGNVVGGLALVPMLAAVLRHRSPRRRAREQAGCATRDRRWTGFDGNGHARHCPDSAGCRVLAAGLAARRLREWVPGRADRVDDRLHERNAGCRGGCKRRHRPGHIVDWRRARWCVARHHSA